MPFVPSSPMPVMMMPIALEPATVIHMQYEISAIAHVLGPHFSRRVKHNIDEPVAFTGCFRPAPKDAVENCQRYK